MPHRGHEGGGNAVGGRLCCCCGCRGSAFGQLACSAARTAIALRLPLPSPAAREARIAAWMHGLSMEPAPRPWRSPSAAPLSTHAAPMAR